MWVMLIVRYWKEGFRRLILVTLITVLTPLAQAEDGPGSSGGGDVIGSEFLATAYFVLDHIPFAPEHRVLLEAALQRVRIVVVETLMDPKTGFKQAVPDQATLIAYGSPGFIQIRKSKGPRDEYTWETKRLRGDSVAHYVVHELFRASGAVNREGVSIDEAFQLSIQKYHLDRLATFHAYPVVT